MKKRRRDPQHPHGDPQMVALIVGLYFAYEEGVERCHQVAAAEWPIGNDLQQRALETAQRIAYVQRTIFKAMTNVGLMDRIAPELSPLRALQATARLGYSLTATAEAEPEPRTILTTGDLDGLPVQYELREWLEYLQASVIGTNRQRWLNVLAGAVVGAEGKR